MTRVIKRRKKKPSPVAKKPIPQHPLFPQFDKTTLDRLRKLLNVKLGEITAEHCVRFTIGNMRYSEKNVRMQIEATISGGKTTSQSDYEKAQKLFNLQPLGSTIFSPMRGNCKIVGYKSRARKYPIIVEANDGKRYRMPRHMAEIRSLDS